jgi:hypothetical protein
MRTLLLCGAAVLGLALMPGSAAAAVVGGAAATDLAVQSIARAPLIQVQHRRGGGHRGGGYRGHGGSGDGAGAAAAGAAIGLFLGAVIATEAQRQQAISYCARRFRSFDPNSMTYVGRDGRRYRCP